ncbi:helix-turn-helix domain-containing protein [Stenotrophomonas sp. S39]|uniref:HVO_A0114 family putative DNA-binding protein n=1 Tax=Stenotrophomonas sp. S39 TaxID=2767451 RepID=UPI00190CDBE1|nr:helix-turn-helix domain-containing protein [Stenotrophomonas sp. S39]
MNEPDRTPIHPTTACRRCIIGGEREGRSAPPQQQQQQQQQQQPDTITFASLSSLAAVLSDENRRLLHTLHQREPQSLTELAGLTGRKVPSLSRTLKMMERYGLVELKRRGVAVIPSALAIRFTVVLD